MRLAAGTGSLALVALACACGGHSGPAGFWTARSSGTSNSLFAVASGSQVVAVGALGTILTSPDGIVWQSRTSGASVHLYGVAASPGEIGRASCRERV